MAPAPYDGEYEGSSDDDDFNFESAVGSTKYPVHDCCEFEDAENLKRLIFVRQDDSDDSSSSCSSSSSSEDQDDDDSETSSEGDQKSTALHSNVTTKTTSHFTSNTSGVGEKKVHNNGNNEITKKESVVNGVLNQSSTQQHSDPSEGNTVLQKSDSVSVQSDKNGSKNGKELTNKVSPEINDKDVSSTIVHEESKSVEVVETIHINGKFIDNQKKGEEISNASNQKMDITTDEKEDRKVISAVTPSDVSLQATKTELKSKEFPTSEEIPRNVSMGKSLDKISINTKQHATQGGKRKRTKRKKTKEPSFYCPYDLDQRDNDENTPLHVAIHARKLECVRLLLEAGADIHKKSEGSAPVHLAVSIGAIPQHTDFSEKCLSLLASYNADFGMKDESLHTPLYLACMSDAPRCAQIILSDPNGLSSLNMRADRIGGRALHASAKYCTAPRRVGLGATHAYRRATGASHPHQQAQGGDEHALITKVLLACPGVEVDPVNNYGQTPLHVAASRGHWATARLLLQAGADPLALDRRGYTPGRLATKRGIAIPNDLETHLGTKDAGEVSDSAITNKRDLIIDPDASTIILNHELCSLHRSCPPIRRSSQSADPPPENVRRLDVLVSEDVGILRCGEFQGCAWDAEARRASIADVLRVHEYTYVERISQLCASIPDHPSAVSSLDPDTAVSRWSFEAAMRAAGAVCEAVDKVMAGDHRNAFCAVRPPGHHAGPRGIVTCPNDPEGSHGFCLLNNVAIGAAYARSMYRNDGIKKVAIIDFDVHHGNGTEEIIRQLVPNIQTSAVRTPFAVGSLHTSRYKPWLDENDINDVFFASTHGYGPRELCFSDRPQAQGGWFYPASGKSHVSDSIRDPSSVERQNLADFISTQTWTRMGDDSRYNCCKIINVGLDLPHPYDVPGMQRIDVRDAYRKKILPYLVEFDPDMIFISAGFDGHKKDGMNFGYVGMIEDDYEWVTEQLIKVANSCCQGRVVSVLEGGYKIHGGIVSPFARSVASHVRALAEGGSSRELYSAEDGEWESEFERNMVLEKDRRRQLRIEKVKSTDLERLRPRSNSFSFSNDVDEKNTDKGNEEAPAAGGIENAQPDIDAIMNAEPLSDVVANSSTVNTDGAYAALQQLGGATPSGLHLGVATPSGLHLGGTTPLHLGGATPSPFHNSMESSDNHQQQQQQQQHGSDEALPSRKRRRNPVDYRELYEQMKKEGNFA